MNVSLFGKPSDASEGHAISSAAECGAGAISSFTLPEPQKLPRFVTHLYTPPDGPSVEVCIPGKAGTLADALSEAGDAGMTRIESFDPFRFKLIMSWSTWVSKIRAHGVPVRCEWETAHGLNGPIRYGRYSIPGTLTRVHRTGGKP
jgi:hypothetical protein